MKAPINVLSSKVLLKHASENHCVLTTKSKYLGQLVSTLHEGQLSLNLFGTFAVMMTALKHIHPVGEAFKRITFP